MLATYFAILMAIFIAMVVGAALAMSGDLEENIKKPLGKALNAYDDKPGESKAKEALKKVWNELQKEVGRW